MRKSRRIVLLAAGLLMPWTVASSASGNRKPDRETNTTVSAIEQIIARERAFSRFSVEHGLRDAFLAFIADNGVVFMPELVNGKRFLSDAQPIPGRLAWSPDFAGVSISGDLGFTTGPYTWTNGEAQDTGQYLTIWRRGRDGEWRFELDRGTPGPTAELGGRPVTILQPVPIPTSKVSAGYIRGNPLDEEQALSEAAKQSAASALLQRLAPKARMLRQGFAPAVTSDARAELLSDSPSTISYGLVGSGASAAGDLAYTYGLAEWEDQGEARMGHFVRLWQLQTSGWSIVIDCLVPALKRRHPNLTSTR